jgi:hypothetical protein
MCLQIFTDDKTNIPNLKFCWGILHALAGFVEPFLYHKGGFAFLQYREHVQTMPTATGNCYDAHFADMPHRLTAHSVCSLNIKILICKHTSARNTKDNRFECALHSVARSMYW